MHTGSIPNTMLIHDTSRYLPGISVDCVVFGFHNNQLKILLSKLPHQDELALPGGYVKTDESVEEAAQRVLKERTGLNDVFLQQFHIFSKTDRVNSKFPLTSLKALGFTEPVLEWLSRRFVTIGFYALVDYSKAAPTPDELSVSCDWIELRPEPALMMDHNEILSCALEALRMHLNSKPIGLNLLPDKFTMPELQTLYETILEKKLDRRNFQRKIASYNILTDLHERKSGVPHKAPFLYRFDADRYSQALKEGLKGGW
jgi:ADP-ribose pyrophosphatase YjhB (NUDIX family)